MKLTEKTTNLHVNWGLVPQDNVAEKVNLALFSGEYPEVFYRAGISSGDLAKYGAQGVFVPLDDLIENYMPNISKILDDNPTIRDGLTMPDGHIYTMPQIYDQSFDAMRLMFKLWVRKDWLDTFGMDVPTTFDEYEAYLDESVNGDPRGDGTKGIIGFADNGIGGLVTCLKGAFDIGNRGTDVGNIDEDPDKPGTVRYWPITDEYREILTYLNKLYSNGLIMKDIFSTDPQKVQALGGDGLLASTYNQTPSGYFEDEGKQYIPVMPLKTDDNPDPTWNAVRSEVVGIGGFVMTDACNHPIEIARWMDWWYSDEGSRAYFMGIEGESYEKHGKGWQLRPEIMKDKSIDKALEPYALYMGGSYPARAMAEWFKGVETTKQATDAAKALKPYALREIWPKFTFTEEESEVLSAQGTDISKHFDESQAGFVTGKKPLSEWDDYVAQFKDMGLDDYLKAHQAGYDRRKN